MATRSRKFQIVTISMDRESLTKLSSLTDLSGYTWAPPIHHYAADANDMFLLENLRRNPPDIFIVDFDVNADQAKRTVHQIRTVLPSAFVFAVSEKSDPGLIINAMRSGCSEYLTKPFEAHRFKEALAEFEKQRTDQLGSTRKARMLTMLGVKGGVGVTTLAVHMATFAARMTGGKTLLIDMHPDLGDVAVYLGLTQQHQYHFFELVANIHRLDEELLQGFVLHHESGLDVLSSPDAFDTAKLNPSNSIDGVLEVLRGMYDIIIIDCPPGLTRFNVSAVDSSDKVALVTTPEVPSVRSLVRYLEHLGRFNCPEYKVDVVVNRDSKRNAISRDQVERAIKRAVTYAIPNDYNELIQAVNTGSPLLPEGHSDLIRSLREWTKAFSGASEAAPPKAMKKRFGILGL